METLKLAETYKMLIYTSQFKNKPAAQAAGADPFRYSFTNRQSSPIIKIAITLEPVMWF